MSSRKIKVGIIGTGNIGSDLLAKVQRSRILECGIFAGHNPDSDGSDVLRKWAFLQLLSLYIILRKIRNVVKLFLTFVNELSRLVPDTANILVDTGSCFNVACQT